MNDIHVNIITFITGYPALILNFSMFFKAAGQAGQNDGLWKEGL